MKKFFVLRIVFPLSFYGTSKFILIKIEFRRDEKYDFFFHLDLGDLNKLCCYLQQFINLKICCLIFKDTFLISSGQTDSSKNQFMGFSFEIHQNLLQVTAHNFMNLPQQRHYSVEKTKEK